MSGQPRNRLVGMKALFIPFLHKHTHTHTHIAH